MKLRRTAPPQGNAILKPQWPPSTAERFNPQGRATAAPCSANCYPLLVSSCLLLVETNLNALENWCCSTSFWRWMTRERLLPWLLGGADVGDHVLEIGAGAGAATTELRKRARHVVSLEYDQLFAVKLARGNCNGGSVVQGDA